MAFSSPVSKIIHHYSTFDVLICYWGFTRALIGSLLLLGHFDKCAEKFIDLLITKRRLNIESSILDII